MYLTEDPSTPGKKNLNLLTRMTQRSDRRQSEVVLIKRIILNVYANNDAETQRYSHSSKAAAD